MVLTNNMYYTEIIKFYAKLKNWGITESYTHTQIKIGEW